MTTLRNKKTGKTKEFVCVQIIEKRKGEYDVFNAYKSLDQLNEDWEDYEPIEPRIEDEMAREIIKKWYNKNKIVGKLCSYGGNLWLGLRGTDEDGVDWEIELNVCHNGQLKDDKLYSLTELIGEEE